MVRMSASDGQRSTLSTRSRRGRSLASRTAPSQSLRWSLALMNLLLTTLLPFSDPDLDEFELTPLG
jgi:hypothetical protein